LKTALTAVLLDPPRATIQKVQKAAKLARPYRYNEFSTLQLRYFKIRKSMGKYLAIGVQVRSAQNWSQWGAVVAGTRPARLHALTRKHRAPIKQFLMDGRRIVGVGNIYASESLFRAGIDPRTPASRLSLARCARLAKAIKHTLRAAIRPAARACATTSPPTASPARRKAAIGFTSAKARRAGAAAARSGDWCRGSARATTARVARNEFRTSTYKYFVLSTEFGQFFAFCFSRLATSGWTNSLTSPPRLAISRTSVAR